MPGYDSQLRRSPVRAASRASLASLPEFWGRVAVGDGRRDEPDGRRVASRVDSRREREVPTLLRTDATFPQNQPHTYS